MTDQEWETERQRHAEFFDGLSPQQEFDRHTIERKRKEMEEND